MTFTPYPADATLDLVVDREVDVTPAEVWQAWTTPAQTVEWFAPKPWTTPACEIELRPGGRFHTVMRSPEGEEYPGTGCILEVVPEQRLVWTTALGPGHRPQASDLPFTAVIELQPTASGGTRYRAIAVHQDEAGAKQHAEMGFVDGWGMVLDQLVEFVTARRSA